MMWLWQGCCFVWSKLCGLGKAWGTATSYQLQLLPVAAVCTDHCLRRPYSPLTKICTFLSLLRIGVYLPKRTAAGGQASMGRCLCQHTPMCLTCKQNAQINCVNTLPGEDHASWLMTAAPPAQQHAHAQLPWNALQSVGCDGLLMQLPLQRRSSVQQRLLPSP